MPESIEEYMNRVRRGEAGVSGDLDAQARSGDPYAQRAKQYQMRENERQAAVNAREAERAQAERQKALEDQEKARQAAIKDQHEKNIRQAESIGAIVEEDIETGRKDVARHDDGHVKFKTGKVKDPYKKDGSWVQDYRNDRGKILSDPIKGETITTQDKANSTGLKVGDKYFERKDDFGKSVFEKVGEDQKVAKLHSIGLETEKAEMVKGRLKIEREAFDEQWKPVSKEYEDAKAARDKFFENPSFRNIDGKWVDSDGREVVTDNQISAFNDWQRKASEVSKQYNDSMEKMGKLSPSNDRLTEAEKGIQGKLNKLAEERAMVELGVENKVLTDGFARSQMRKRGFGEDLDRLDREQAEKFTAYINPFDGKNFDSPVPFSTPAGETLMIPENAKLLWGDKADTVIRMFRLGADEQQIDALFPDEKPKAGIEEVSAVIGAAASTESGQIGQTQKALAESTSPESPDEWISRINEGLPGADPGSLRAERKDMRTTYLVSLYSNVGGRERQIGSIEQGPDGKPILEASIHRDLEREVIKHPGSLPHYLYPRDIKSNYREKKISSEDWNERLEKVNAVIEAGEEFALSSEYTYAKVLEALGGPLGGTIEEHLTYLYKQGAINNQQWEANMEKFAPHVRTRIPDITSEEVIESEMKSYFQSIEDPEQKKRYAISQSGDNEKLRKTLQKEALERYSAEFKWHPGYDREELQKAYEKVGYKRGTGEFIEDAAINAAGSSVGVIEGVGMQALSATVGWFMPDDIEEAWEQIAKDAKNKTGDKLRGFDFWQGQLTEEEAREAYREVSDKLNKVVIAVDNNEPLEDRLDELSAWVKEMNTKSRDDSASETDSRFDLKKSPAFLNLVEQYRLTANPEYKEAMRAYIFADDYHRRVMSEAMTISTGRDSAMETGFSRRWTNFVDSYYGALNADYVEVGTEIASYGVMKAGSALSKQAIKGTSKLATKVDELVWAGEKVGLHAKVANSVHKAGLQARDELVSAMRKVMVEDTLANPAGKVGKTWNKAVKGAPSAVAGGIGEGAEEVVASLGETTTTFDSAFEAFIQGAIGGPAVAPIMAVAQAPVSLAGKAQNSSRERVADRKFADWYNKTFAKEDGFQEITSEDANTMRAFLSAANSDAVIKDYSEAHKKIIEADATLERIKGMENRNDAAWQVSYEKANKTIRENYEKLVESEAALADIATLAVSARMDIAKMPAAERTRYTALAKVAAGNEGLLTKNERASIAGLKTEEDNFDYFTKPIDTLEGKGNQLVTRQQTFITKEGREEIARKAPAIANLALQTEIRTPDESSSAPSTVAETAIVEEPTGGNEVRRALDKAISLLPSSVPVSFVEDAGESGMSAAWRGINVSLAQLESQVGQLGSQEAIEARIAAMIDEERVHVAQFEAVREMAARDGAENLEEYFETYYTEVWESFTPEQQQAIRDVYQVEEASNAQLAAEGIRMLIQDRANKKVTELTKSFSQGLSEEAKEALRGILDALKKLTGVDLTPLVKSHIEAIEGILAEDSSVDGDGNQKGNEGKPESVIADDTSKVSGKPERKPSSKKTAKKKRNIVTISDVAESGMYGEILLIADHPLIKSIEAQGGILSKTNYQKQGGKNLDLYDGAGKYPPALNKEIYSKSGLAPDVMAQNLYSGERQDGGNSTLLDSPTHDALWDAIEEAYSSVAENNRISRKKFAEVAREETKKLDFYEEAFNREDGDLAIPAKSLVVGDTLVVDGEELVVEALRKDSDGQIDRVTLQDGSRFDRQFVDGDMTLYVESIDEIYEESDPEGKILPDEAYLEEEAAANTPKKKEATSKGFDGEGGDLLSDQKEDFKLAQDETLDGAKVAKDKEEAEKRAEKAEQDQQKLELDEPTLSEGEQALKDAFKEMGIKLDASPDSPVTPPFYSQLSRVIESKIQGRFASPQQIKAVIDPAKGSGVKEEEIKWSGIVQKVDELATENKGKVPIVELKDWLASDGAVRLNEVKLKKQGRELLESWADIEGYDLTYFANGEVEVRDIVGDLIAKGTPESVKIEMNIDPSEYDLPDDDSPLSPKYSDYQLPGGENYRETVLSMPLPRGKFDPEKVKIERRRISATQGEFRVFYDGKELSPWYSDSFYEVENFTHRFLTDEEIINTARRNYETGDKPNNISPGSGSYTSSHFPDVPNYVAHMRLNERENGLFIEEIQSDRHQEGRKKGYNDERASDAEVIAYMGLKPDISPERIEIARKAMEQRVNAIPDAPFRKDWPLQMFKRALRDAVDSDKDWIGWTTGDTQAERYDLSKQVDRITVLEHAYAPGTYTVTARRNGDEVINKSANSQSEMADLIGKDLAKKAVADIEAAKQRPVPKYATTLEGLDLKVGGEGMKGFYDQILPRAVQKYVKQWGGKVKLQKIGGEPIMKMVPHEVPGHPGGRLVEDEAKSSTETNIWRLDITPDMKSSIRKDGMALFASPDRSFTTGIPADKLPAFISAAQKLVSDGVNTPEKLVESLEKIGKGNLRQYTDAVWSALRMVDPSLPQVEEWSTFYTSDEKSEDGGRSPESVMEAYEAIGDAVISRLRSRLPIDKKEIAAIDKNEILQKKEIEEAIEAGAAAHARTKMDEGREPFGYFIRLNDELPVFSAKTSTSKINQAYSTPIPLAYAASKLADISNGKVVLEPTAGHGVLLGEVTEKQTVYFNELDQNRIDRVMAIDLDAGKWEISNEDGTTFRPAKAPDRIIANPPFGTVTLEDGSKKVFKTPFGETSQIDHAIVSNSLESMSNDGRAVFIIGGPPNTIQSNKARRDYYSRGSKAKFFEYLYKNYGVVDHLTVNGDLYAKQGAGWPVDIIVIQGKTPTKAALPYAKEPTMIESWSDLEKILTQNDNERVERRSISEREIRETVEQGLAQLDSIGGKSIDLLEPPGSGQSQGGDRGGDRSPTVDQSDAGRTGENEGVPTGVDGQRQAGDSSTRSGDRPANQVAGKPKPSPRAEVQGENDLKKATRYQTEYKPVSGGFELGTLIPHNMAAPVSKALNRIKDDIGGDMIGFVRDKLGYPKGTDITKFLAGEQIDAISAAIWNFERGGALIIGDQTGIGKGRIAAGLIKYAIHNGKVPVLVTANNQLADEMITEHLAEINDDAVRPAELNSVKSMPVTKERNLPVGQKYFERVAKAGSLVDGANAIFATYYQISTDVPKGLTKKERDSSKAAGKAYPDGWRMKALKALGKKAVFILDEAHKGAGTSNAGYRIQDLIMGNPVAYLSATAIKRPENMGVFYRTNVGALTDNDPSKIIDMMNSGGVPAMQVVSSMLSADGQMLRRERSYEGVDFATKINEETYERDAEKADKLAAAIKQIIMVQEMMQEAADTVNDIMKSGGKARGVKAGNRGGIESANFSSTLHNLVSQYLLAIKTQATIDTAIQEIQNGNKVVVALSSTMESAIDTAEERGFDLTFKGVVQAYLDKQRFLKVKNKNEPQEVIEITAKPLPGFGDMTDAQLRRDLVQSSMSPDGDNAVRVNPKAAEELLRRMVWSIFERAKTALDAIDLGDLPLSPIDAIRNAAEAQGIKTGEMTGRSKGIDAAGEIYVRTPNEKGDEAKASTKYEFNNGDLDLLIINESAAEGISLHASETAKNKKQRTMIVAQPHSDINKFMQILGRIHRSGQVVLPKFILLQTALPAEKRPAAVLGTKMAALNANTTSNAKTEVSDGNEALDLFNKYGDKIAFETLSNDPDLQRSIYPLANATLRKLYKNDGASGMVSWSDAESAISDLTDGSLAKMITGYLAALPVEDQRIFWDTTTANYVAYIDYLDEMGENDLEAKVMDLRAKVTKEEIFTEGGTGDSVFDSPSFAQTVEVQLGDPPLSGNEVEEIRKNALRGAQQEVQDYQNTAKQEIDKKVADKARKVLSWNAEKENQFRGGLNDVRNKIAAAMGSVGRYGTIKRDDGSTGLGVVENVVQTDSNSPLTPSKFYATILVNDTRSRLKIPISQFAEAFTLDMTADSQEWDSGLDTSSTRTIVVGNLAAALEKVSGRANVIEYTTDKGVVQLGLMLPKGYTKTEQQKEENAITINSAEELEQRIEENRTVTNGDKSIKIIGGMEGGIILEVPANQSVGGKYWRNPRLNRALEGGEFVQVSNKMRGTIKRDSLSDAYEVLREIGGVMTAGGARKADSGGPTLKASPDNIIPFPASYRSLGVPREDMPQIKSGDHSAFVQFLEARGVKYSKREVPAKNLKPTQSGYDPAKVEKAKGFDSERSVLVSGDGYILDGHHGWKAAEEDGNKVSILALKAPIKRLLELAKEFPSEQTKKNEGGNPLRLEASPITPEQDAEYLSAVESGDMETAQRMVDEAARAAGYGYSHRRSDGQNPVETGYIVLFAESGNEHYGEKDHVVNVSVAPFVPDWVIDWYMEHPDFVAHSEVMEWDTEEAREQAEREVNPPDIVETAGMWDNPQTVSDFWYENEDRLIKEGISGFQTSDGAVIFDASGRIIKSADPVTYDENGNVIPLSERFNENSDSILYSSPDSPSDLNPTQKAMKALLEKSPPLYRDVFLKTLSDSSLLPGEIGKEFGISEKAVQNITRAMKARLNTLIKVADSEKGDTIQPQRDPATGKIEGGRPDLALSGVPEVAAVDQARNEEGLPEVRAHAEAEAEARGMLARDYDGTIEELERVHRGGGTFTDAQTMAAKIIIATESSQATTMDKARLLRFANFIHTYREVGTETARALSARRDPQLNPQERARLYLVESMVTPSGAAAHRLRKADTAEEKTAILEEWITKMQTVRDGLKTGGFDIDEALEWSAQSDDILRDSDQRSPLGDYITIAINRADAVTKVVASTIRTGAAKGTPVPELLKQAAQSSGTTMERAAKLYQDFQDYILSVRREAMAKGADLALSASAEEMADLEAIGLIDISDYFERDGKPKKNPPKQSPKRHSNMPPARDRPRSEWDAWVAKEMDRRFKRHQQDPLNIDPPKPLKDFKGAWDINDPKQSRKLIEAMGMSAGLTWDKILEWRKMSILTGVKTHTTNILSNTLFSAYELLPKRLVEATYSQTLSMMGFKDKEAGSPTFSEFLVMAFNMRKAIMKGLDLLVRSYQTRSRIFEAEALARPELIDFDGVKADHIPPQLRNKLAKLLRTISFDTLTAFDEMAKGIVGTLESAAYAHRLAKKDGLKGAEYKEFIAKELEYGSQSWNYAVKRAEEMTFQSELGQSEAIVDQTFDTLARAINRGKRGKMKVILDLVFPFVNTPTNIFKKGWNYSPLGTATAIIDASRALRELMKGDNKIASRAAAERLYNRARLMNDLAQQTLAWAGTMAILNMLEADEDDLLEIEGNIPWRGPERALRDLGYRRGMGPYTLRIGDLKIAYNRYEPVATAVGFAVDAAKVWKKDTDMATKAAGIASVVMNSSREKTYLRGVSDLMDAWDDVEALGDGDEYAQFSATNGLSRLIASQITSLVPNLYRQAARGSDEFIRERAVDRSSPLLIQIGQHINADLNQNAQAPKVDLWGNDIENHSGLFLPGQVTRGLETDEKDEYLHAYNRKFGLTKELKSVLKNSPFTLQQQVNGQRGSLKMTPEMRREYMQIQGKFLREDLKGIEWDTTNPSQEGIEIMADSRSRAASHAREEILYKYHKEIQWPQ